MDKTDKVERFAFECLLEAVREAGLYCGERGIQPSLKEAMNLADAIKEKFHEKWSNDSNEVVSRKLLAEAREFGVQVVDELWPKSKLN